MQGKNGWTSPELAIHGGAKFLKEEYLTYYQDTGYLQKYSVDPAGKNLYKYQYMQNVSAPYSEARTTKKAYINMGLMDSGFNFIVPVFENMPVMASPRPGRTTTLVTENVKVTTQNSPLSIRSGPSTGYNIIAKANIGATLIRIEKAEDAYDGIYWDKVVYVVGNELTIGYATREYLGDIATVQTVNEPKITTEMCNLRNGPGTTESRVKQVLSAGTAVTVIDKMNNAVDGHIWYRVMLADGTQGYVSSAYLKDGVVEKYKIDGTYIKIIPETTIADIPGAVLNGNVFGTGASITKDGVEYTLVVLGDVNGDGNITPADYVRIKNHIMNVTPIEGIYTVGADVNGDGGITPADYVRVKNHIMNVTKIYL